MPRTASARHRARLASAVRHLKAKADLNGNRVFAQAVPRFLQMPDAYPQVSSSSSVCCRSSHVQDPDAMSTSNDTPAPSMVNYRDVSPTPSSMVDYRDVTPTPSSMVDDRELTPTPSAMNVDGPQPFALHRLIQLPGFPLSPQAIAGPSRFPGCLDWDEHSSHQKEASVAYIITPVCLPLLLV
jgi:hypothetical protein